MDKAAAAAAAALQEEGGEEEGPAAAAARRAAQAGASSTSDGFGSLGGIQDYIATLRSAIKLPAVVIGPCSWSPAASWLVSVEEPLRVLSEVE